MWLFFMADWHDLEFVNKVWTGSLSRHLQWRTQATETRSVAVYVGRQLPWTDENPTNTIEFQLTCQEGVHHTKGETRGNAEHVVEDGIVTLTRLRF